MITLDTYIGRLFYNNKSGSNSDIFGGIAHLNLVWKINNTEDVFTIPHLLLEHLDTVETINNMRNSELVMPIRFLISTMYGTAPTYEFKSFATFFKNVPDLMHNKRVVKCIVENETYYVGNDLILDVNLVPILTFGYEIKYNSDIEKYSVLSKILYVSPSVYDNLNKMSRFLSNKFIPAFLSPESLNYPIRTPINNCWMSINRKASNVKVIIDAFHSPFKLIKCEEESNLVYNYDAINEDIQHLFQ